MKDRTTDGIADLVDLMTVHQNRQWSLRRSMAIEPRCCWCAAAVVQAAHR
jgi:hypothetical protein